MDRLYLKIPAPEDEASVWAMRQEMLDAKEHFDGCSQLNKCDTYDAWLAHLALYSSAETCPADKVSSTVYLAVRERDSRVVGVIDLRHSLDHPVLALWGGHIGYSVRPSERRKGYGTQMLRLNLQNAKARGLMRVMITCHDGNIASEKVIRACGGVYEKSVNVEGEIIKRFWIDLTPGI